MYRRLMSVFITVLLLMSLCGCNLLVNDTDTLLSPPALMGDLNIISQKLKESVKSDYTLKYPSRGNYHSAFVREDIDGDGILEAFAFYSIVKDENVTMNFSYIRYADDEWNSVSEQTIVAGGVDMIDFCDLDNDGTKELLVGWEIYGTSEMKLAVYSLGENSVTSRMLQRYTHFNVCDLNEDGKKEIFIVNANNADSISFAELYELSKDGVNQISSCELDNSAKTFGVPIISTTSSGKPAIYIDEIKGIGAVTEVLTFEKGVLVNPFFLTETEETSLTLRSAIFNTEDIDGDGILEIPVQRNVPSVAKSELNEKLYLIDWCSFNGEKLNVRQTTMIDSIDGYFYTIPSQWVGKIAVLKDTENRVREIYEYNKSKSQIGERLIYFKTVKKSDWDSGKLKSENAREIMRNDDDVFICRISSAAESKGIKFESVKSAFKIFEQE